MKKEYNFTKAKRRAERAKVDTQPVKLPTSIRLDGSVLAWFKAEAERQGIPYQTLIGSVLFRYANNELVDKAEVKRIQKIKGTA